MRRTSPNRPLAAVAVLLLLVVAWRLALPDAGIGTGDPSPALNGGSTPTRMPGGVAGAPGWTTDTVRLDARGCFDAGYLCEGVRGEPEPRVLRWADDVTEIVVHVGLPEGPDGSRSRALQRAAAAGIRQWQGNPLALRLELGRTPRDADVRVTWTRSLGGRELGKVSSRWIGEGVDWRVEVDAFVLATHEPGSGRAMTPAQVELTAAHEMGHVLGLPHSDDPRDVMYPLNTSLRLTSRDFRTLGALYDLPVGAVLEVQADGGR